MTNQEESGGEELPAMQLEERTCRTCQFFEFAGDDRARAASGECRRNAPRPGSANDEDASWPKVRWKHWCGEWAEGVSYEEMIRLARREG